MSWVMSPRIDLLAEEPKGRYLQASLNDGAMICLSARHHR